MNRSWWIGAALLLTAASAVLLPQMESLQSSAFHARGTVETFLPGRGGIVLGDGNLVDRIGSLPFTLSIGSAGWEEGVLSLDLTITDSSIRPGEVYADMARVFSFAFGETENVDQVLLRIIAEDKWTGTSRLLLAADARRSELMPGSVKELQEAGDRPLSAALKSAVRISETALWKNQFMVSPSG